MNELELKHLSPYLPYGLRIRYILGKGSTWTLTQFNIEQFSDVDKPILRPLSDLTKEIVHNGEKFVPIDYFIYKTSVEDFTEFPEQKHNLIHGLKYADVQLLLEWHFDIFGLIEKGLSIDINALNK